MSMESNSFTKGNLTQDERLRDTIRYASVHSPFYREIFARLGIQASDIQTVADLVKLPVTTKEDLQNRNADFISVPKNKIVDYVTTSGTLGEPVTFALTDGDLERLAENEANSFKICGCGEDDVFQLMTTIDKRFMAGLAYFLGARKLGAGIIRVGAGVPELQWDTIRRLSPTTMIAVPSFIVKLIEYAEKHQIDYRNSSVKKAICIGEPLRNKDFSLNALGKRIKEKWDIELYSTYASTEMGTAFTECEHGVGGHHQPELIIVEFLDEENKPVGNDEAGEVTITTLGVEGMPMIRFKTGDVCHHFTEPCACGRITMRLGPVIGRKKQMIKYKGTTLFPPAIIDVLNSIPGITMYLIELHTNEIQTDEIRILLPRSIQSGSLENELKELLKSRLRVTPEIVFVDDEELRKLKFPEMNRKPVELVDRRG